MGIFFRRDMCAFIPVIDKCRYLPTNNSDINNYRVIYELIFEKYKKWVECNEYVFRANGSQGEEKIDF